MSAAGDLGSKVLVPLFIAGSVRLVFVFSDWVVALALISRLYWQEVLYSSRCVNLQVSGTWRILSSKSSMFPEWTSRVWSAEQWRRSCL